VVVSFAPSVGWVQHAKFPLASTELNPDNSEVQQSTALLRPNNFDHEVLVVDYW
jgi:hypothetical protein